MKSENIERLIQVVTAIAVLVGLGLVIWELRQAKSLAFTQIIHANIDNAANHRVAVYGEELRHILSKACFEPDDLDRADAFVLDAYFISRVEVIQRLKVQADIAGFSTPWRLIAQETVREIISFPQGRAWLDSSNSWILAQPDVVEFVGSLLSGKVEPCSASINRILGSVNDEPQSTK